MKLEYEALMSEACDKLAAAQMEIGRLRTALETVWNYSNDPAVVKMVRYALDTPSVSRPPKRNSNGAAMTDTPPDDLLGEVWCMLNHARIFIVSREKMHPDGVKLYDELRAKIGVIVAPGDTSLSSQHQHNEAK